MRHYKEAVATSTAGQEVVIWQNTNGTTPPRNVPSGSYRSIIVRCWVDQPITLLHKWGPTPDTADGTLKTINGPAQAGETVAASSFFEREIRLGPGRDRISALMGTPAPTATFIAYELNDSAFYTSA